MIIAHLAFEKDALLACRLTCRSWYIAAAPHLHHTLITPFFHEDRKAWWPPSFRDMRKLGLFPLVKKLQIQGLMTSSLFKPIAFSPKLFDPDVLRQFSSLTNVQELGIDHLDIPSFITAARTYFNHFLPTVRSLALRQPRGSRLQIVFFIGLFEHLEDLHLLFGSQFQEEPPDLLPLVPRFTPPLRGRLTMKSFVQVGIGEDLINSFGGIRFRHVDLVTVDGMQLVLEACADTLETFRFDPSDPLSE